MYSNKKICVFCSSSNLINEDYLKEAENLGVMMAKNNIICVNGGGVDEQGSMARMNEAIYKNKGKNISVIHEIWIDKNNYKQHKWLTEEIVLKGKDLSDRKKIMRDKSDAFIILPGGTGTIDELMEIIELKKSGFLKKNIYIVNTKGFYDPIINFLFSLKNNYFMKQNLKDLVYIVKDVNELGKLIL